MMVVIGVLAMFRDNLRSKVFAGVLLAFVFCCAVSGPTSVIRSANGAVLGWPGYKIAEPALSLIREIAATVPDGSMFAPVEISGAMLVYSSRYPQYHMREDYLEYVLSSLGMEAAFLQRSKVYQYLYQGDDTGESERAFQEMLASDTRPYLIVVLKNTPRLDQIEQSLTARDYRKSLLNAGGYLLFKEARRNFAADQVRENSFSDHIAVP
jgi:hypothetical protein